MIGYLLRFTPKEEKCVKEAMEWKVRTGPFTESGFLPNGFDQAGVSRDFGVTVYFIIIVFSFSFSYQLIRSFCKTSVSFNW